MRQLQHYLWVIRHLLWLILLGVGICSGLTFGISKYIIQPTYQASALLQVNRSLTSDSTTSSNDVYNAQLYAISDSLLITSSSVLGEVAQKVPDVSLSQLEKAVSASPQANTQIIEIRAKASNPQLAANIANTVLNVFIQQQLGQATTALKSQDTQLSQNLQTIKTAINQDQAQLTVLQKSGATGSQIDYQNSILAADQTNYNSTLTDEHQVQLQISRLTSALTIEQLAMPPNQPSSPNILLNTMIAAALGLLLMLVLALLLDWLDTSIQAPEDVARLALLEPFGRVPFSKQPLLVVNPANPSSGADDAIKQAFMIMGIGFNALNNSQHAVLVTSLRTGSGVTTTAINLAITLAQLGKRVLLVDANLNRPSLHEIFQMSNTKGLVNSLVDVYQFHEGIIQSWLNLWRTNIPNLWLLPVGSVATHSPMIERLQELQMLTNWLLRKNQNTSGKTLTGAVDIVIFDASPLTEGADTLSLASITDCSLLVIQAGKEQGEMVSEVGTTLQRFGSPLLGVVVNRLTTKHRPYFYTDDRRQQMAISTGSPSLEDALASSLSTRQILPLNTPPSLVSINHQYSLTGHSSPYPNGVFNPTNAIVPSTPLPQEQSGNAQFKIRGSNHFSNENSN